MSDPLPGAVVRSGKDPASIADAVIRLRAQRLVAVPTETVYGLAARTLDPAAIEEIYEVKGRPKDNPLIAHVSSIEMARSLVSHWPEEADRLALVLWPGPLTIVLPKADSVPSVSTGGRDSIAIRIPAHSVALEVIHRLGEPISAPSANRSGSLSATEARHVLSEFVDHDLLVLDGGPCRVGLESTVIDLRGRHPEVLRPGVVTPDRLSAILGVGVDAPKVDKQADSPGTTSSHYAPATETRLCSADEAGGEDVESGGLLEPLDDVGRPLAGAETLHAVLEDLNHQGVHLERHIVTICDRLEQRDVLHDEVHSEVNVAAAVEDHLTLGLVDERVAR